MGGTEHGAGGSGNDPSPLPGGGRGEVLAAAPGPTEEAGGASSIRGTRAVLSARGLSGGHGRLCEDRPPPSSLIPTVSPVTLGLLLPSPDGGHQDGVTGRTRLCRSWPSP